MAVGAEALESLLKHGQFKACSLLAREYLTHSDVSPSEKVQCRCLLVHSLVGDKEYTAAVEEGTIAAHLAEEHEQYDLLGRVLLHLSAAEFHLGCHAEASAHLERFFRYLPRMNCSRELEGRALINQGIYLRALSREDEALTFFKRAWDWWRRRDPVMAERARTNATWQALESGHLDAAAKFLPLGEEYLQQHPDDIQARLLHLNDAARFRLLRGEHSEAARLAWECLGLSEEHPSDEAVAFLTLAYLARSEGQPEPAISAALLAKLAAEQGNRPDLAAEAQQLWSDLSFQFPYAEENVVRRLTARRQAT